MQSLKNKIKFLKNINILYVEDNEDIRNEMIFTLENRVKNLYIAQDGQIGLDLYKKYKPDIIVTDITMPNLDGIAMSELIRKENKDIPIIVISAYNDSDNLIKAIDVGITNFLMKPLNLKKLFDVLERNAKNVLMEKENLEINKVLEEYKSIADETEIVSKTTPLGIITYVNEPFVKISGYLKEELIGQNHNILTHPAVNKEVFSSMWKDIKDNKKTWKGKVKNLNKNKESFYLDISIKPILDENGEIKEYISMSNDITSLEITKNFLKTQNIEQSSSLDEALISLEQYEKGINESNVVTRTDLNGNITYANKQFIRLSGYSKDELIGSSHNIVRHEDNSEEVFSDLWNTITDGKIWRGTLKNKNKQGLSYYVDTVILPIINSQGKIIEYLGIRHDITEVINLHKEFEESQREIIYRMGEIGESRSKETGNHVKRVAQYSRLFGKLYGLEEEKINYLFMASPMHDIGKVGIPDNILNKPGKLDKEEWEIMQTHAEIGYNILKDSSRPLLKAAAIVSYTHHEKWNGSGYPRGLKGEDIHIYGRITAIADVFDALGSSRCYKKAWDLEKIYELFKEQRAIHFDPKLVDIFFENIDEFLLIRDKYVD